MGVWEYRHYSYFFSFALQNNEKKETRLKKNTFILKLMIVFLYVLTHYPRISIKKENR